MQRLIAKYGLAAHLALLAVAPLFLFPFFAESTIVVVMLWLTLAAAGWVLLEPSIFAGESLLDARLRVAKAIFHDPLFWTMVVVSVFAGLRALNTGISLVYDAEMMVWRLSSAVLPFLPGSVGPSGFWPFAIDFSILVLFCGIRHAMGRAARTMFLLLSTSLAGTAGIIAHLAVFMNIPVPSAGFVFGLYLLAALIALVSVMERGWYVTLPWMILALGGTSAALFSFSPAVISLATGGVFVLLLIYVLVYAVHFLEFAGELKVLLIVFTALVLAALLVGALLPNEVLNARLAPYANLMLFSEDYEKIGAVLARISFKSWISHLWVGSGLSSFALVFRFRALPEEWLLMPMGPVIQTNAWWVLLVERGVIGVAFLLVPLFLLVLTYVERVCAFFRTFELPHPAGLLLPFLLGLFITLGFFDGSPLRAEAVMTMGALLAISAVSFPKRKA